MSCIEITEIDKFVKKIGRTWQMKEDTSISSAIHLGFSASGIEFVFEGSFLAIEFLGDSVSLDSSNENNHARIGIFVDEQRKTDFMLNKQNLQVCVFNQEQCVSKTVTVLKLSESAMSTCAVSKIIVDKNAKIYATKNKNRFIEFIGDSITCGYGIDDEKALLPFSTKTEDATLSYGYKTAQNLKADYSLVCLSGYGILSGYTATKDQNTKELLPPYYDKVAFSYGKINGDFAQNVFWDFKQNVDCIVIFLGTNDDSFCQDDKQKQLDFAKKYTEFLQFVRSKNKSAKILCILGTMTDRLFDFVQKAVADYCEISEDKNVFAKKLFVQDPADGYASDSHPSKITQQKTANLVTSFIKEIMNW